MVRKRDLPAGPKPARKENPSLKKVWDVSLVGDIWRAKIYGFVVTAWCVFRFI